MKTKFLHTVTKLLTGTVIAQIILIASTPIITRLYSPEQFGIFGVIFGFVSVLALVANGKLDLAINIEQNKNKVLNLFISGVLLSLLTALTFLIIAFLLNHTGMISFDFDVSLVLLFILSIFIVSNGVFDLLVAVLISKGSISTIAKSQILKASLVVLIQIVGSYMAPEFLMLLLSQSLSVLIVCLYVLYKDNDYYFKKRSFLNFFSTLKSNSQFIKYSTPQVLVSAIGFSLPIFVVAYYFGPKEAGFYWIANRLLAIPSQMVSKSIRGIIQRRLASFFELSIHAMRNEVIKLISILGLIYVPICLFLVLFGEHAFALVLGDDWRDAGIVAVWLSVAWLGCFLNIPAVSVFPILKRQRDHLKFEIISVTLRIVAMVLAATFYSFRDAVMTYSVVFFMLNIALILSVLCFYTTETENEFYK